MPGVPRTFDHDCSCLGHKLHLLYQKWYLQVGHWLYRYRYSKKIIGYLNPFSPRPAKKKTTKNVPFLISLSNTRWFYSSRKGLWVVKLLFDIYIYIVQIAIWHSFRLLETLVWSWFIVVQWSCLSCECNIRFKDIWRWRTNVEVFLHVNYFEVLPAFYCLGFFLSRC